MTESQLRQKVVGIMRGWIGKKESDGSHREIIDLYNAHKPLARNYAVKYTDAWCATAVSAAAIQAGLTDIIPTECSCANMIALLKKQWAWQENDAYVPLPGDILFYDWQDTGNGDNTGAPDHVGIVECVSGGVITVIEGNYSDSVKRRNIAVNGRYIRGFGVPDYKSKAEAETAPNTTGVLSIGDTVHFQGSRQYVSAFSGSKEVSARPCAATVTAMASGRQHPYHLIGGGVEGWVDAADIEGVSGSGASVETLQIGDIVIFTGNTHYNNSYAGARGFACKGGEAKVTAINRNGTYPFHLVHSGKGCTVNGWVNAADVTRSAAETK